MAAAWLPSDPEGFKGDRGTKWNLTIVPGTDKDQKLDEGTIFSSSVHRLGWDKGRTSSIDGRVFWNFGDCLSIDGIDGGPNAGFSMGAAFYADVREPLRVQMVRILPALSGKTVQPSVYIDITCRVTLIASVDMTLRSLGLAQIPIRCHLRTGSMEWIRPIQCSVALEPAYATLGRFIASLTAHTKTWATLFSK